MNFIAIDTSTNICSAALFNNSKLINVLEDVTFEHSKILPVFINELLKDSEPLDYIALSIGPGSFTGLKVGSSFAKGLAAALKIPIIPINTFDGIKYTIQDLNTYYISIYSHRKYAFTCLYNNYSEKNTDFKCIEIDKLLDYKIYGYGFPDNLIIDYEEVKPNAKNIGLLSFEKFDTSKTYNIDDINPIYLMIEK